MRHHGVTCLDQARYIGVQTAECDVLECKSVLTHMSAHFDLAKSSSPHVASLPFGQLVKAQRWVERHPYREIMRSGTHLAQFCTSCHRNNFLVALHVLSQCTST